jgi:hypothetical protein
MTPWPAIIRTATERSSLALAFLGLILSIVYYHLNKELSVPAYILVYCWIFFAIAFWIILSALALACRDQNQTPKVRSIVKDEVDPDFPIMLVDPNPLFGNSSLVSVYYRQNENQYEVLIGHGFVRAVQGNQILQVKIEEWTSGNDDIVGKVSSNDAQYINNIVLRPSIARGDIQIRDANLKLMVVSALREEIFHLSQNSNNLDSEGHADAH